MTTIDYSTRLKTERMDDAVYAAIDLFLKNGIDNVKMTDIADKSEIGVASLYRYFGTKIAIAAVAGATLWNDIKKSVEKTYRSKPFLKKNGFGRIRVLLEFFPTIYKTNKPFLKYISNFDRFIVNNKVDAKSLEAYEKSVLDFYPYFTACYELGVADGSIKKGIDYHNIYLLATHTLLTLCQKFILGEVLVDDDFSNAEKELKIFIDMIMDYIKA